MQVQDPSLDELLDKVESKFALVTLISKRAKQVNNGARTLVSTPSQKPVTIAMEEISAGKVRQRMADTRVE
jgi:DNA-directed RNA polymerase subunit omega